MDINELSAEQIKQLQAELAKKLDEKVEQERYDFAEKIAQEITGAGFDLEDIVSILQERISDALVKYRHPDDPTKVWSGRGRMPHWLHELIDAGARKEDFEI